MNPIILNATDTDFYTYTTMQKTFYSNYSTILIRQKFKWRNLDQSKLTISMEDLKDKIIEQINYLSELKHTPEELEFLHNNQNMTHTFIKFFITHYQIKRNYIKVWVDEDNILNLEIKGPWIFIRPIETPMLAIIEQLIMQNSGKHYIDLKKEAEKRLFDKLEFVKNSLSDDDNYSFYEFGTRRRWDRDFHEFTISELMKIKYFKGTSNVYFSMKYGLEPVGTMDHQLLCTYQQIVSRIISQKVCLREWLNFYDMRLGIALSDTLGFDKFLKDFDRELSMRYAGCRHDSGDPFDWGYKLTKHYEKFMINPKNKTYLFSDGLDFVTSLNLWSEFKLISNPVSALGTYLSNDCGIKPANIVIKTVEANGKPVAKISDSPGKGMCLDEEYEKLFKEEIRKDLE